MSDRRRIRPARLRIAIAAVAVAALAAACATPYQVVPGAIPATRDIQPTAIVLHWWGYHSPGGIQSLIDVLNGQTGYYEPQLTKAQVDYNAAHGIGGHKLGVQVGITHGGGVYQLTPHLNSYAAHAACGNPYSIGIEIEGYDAAELRTDAAQFEAVVTTTADLMKRFHIPLDGLLAPNGNSGVGVHSHKEIDINCKYADGQYAGAGKDDVDDQYLALVKYEIRRRGLG